MFCLLAFVDRTSREWANVNSDPRWRFTVSQVFLASLALGLVLCSRVVAQGTGPRLYVGPQVRDGFVDIDSGIRDSIRDIKEELKRTDFRVVASREDATLVLIVVARGIVTNGSVGFSSNSAIAGTGSGFGFVVPNSVPTLTTALHVATYNRVMQSEGPTWGRAAKTVVDDLLAWWEANRKAVEALK